MTAQGETTTERPSAADFAYARRIVMGKAAQPTARTELGRECRARLDRVAAFLQEHARGH